MISICIPVYNFNVTPLVKALQKEMEHIEVPVELILIDDCSEESYRDMNNHLTDNYIQLPQNLGRAKIRNLFLNYAQYDYLLFLDCDSLVVSPSFIQNYINAILQSKASVFCGGRIYKDKAPARAFRLNWKYGVKAESKTAEERRLAPYKSFLTNNFLATKNVLSKIPFDERIANYGHEDTLFGYRLKQQKIMINHIDNPILNGDIEENSIYLSKSELAVENLFLILKNINFDANFIKDVSLVSFYFKLKKWRLTTLIKGSFWLLKPFLKQFLIFGFSSLILFNYYKLGTFATIAQKKS